MVKPSRTPEARSAAYHAAADKAHGTERKRYTKGGAPETYTHQLGYFRMRRYGITEEQYQQMLADQGNACAICRTPFEGVKVCVDHCHATGRVRGLLCDGCNRGLGCFKDEVQRVAAAIKYLAKGD